MYDGVSNELKIKMGSIFIMLSEFNVTNEEDYNYLNKFEESIINIITSKKILMRTSLSELYGYHSKNHITNETKALEYINNIISELSNYSFSSDDNFVLLGRKKYIYDEINSNNSYYQEREERKEKILSDKY